MNGGTLGAIFARRETEIECGAREEEFQRGEGVVNHRWEARTWERRTFKGAAGVCFVRVARGQG